MGSSPKAGQKTAPQMMSYGGTNMNQADAQAKYQADMAAWRAPTSTGLGTAGMDTGTMVAAAPTDGGGTGHLGVPTTDWTANPFGGGGPALPALGVLPTAPIAVPRTILANTMRQPYRPDSGGGGQAGRQSSAGYGYGGGGSYSGTSGGRGGSKSSARSGGLY